jgi:acetolactate synthase-1/3 small subunit
MSKRTEHLHIISILVANRPGVLARVAGLFSSRAYNIMSLTVGETESPTVSRMTISVTGDDATLEQIRKQLGKLIDTIKVQDYSGRDFVQRDLLLVKISAPAAKRSEIFELCEVFRGNVVDIGTRHVMVEVSGPEAKIEAFLQLLKPYGIKEVARSGRIAMLRGVKET